MADTVSALVAPTQTQMADMMGMSQVRGRPGFLGGAAPLNPTVTGVDVLMSAAEAGIRDQGPAPEPLMTMSGLPGEDFLAGLGIDVHNLDATVTTRQGDGK